MLKKFMFLATIASMVLAACGAPATTAPQATSAPAATDAPEATTAPAATEAPAATTAPSTGKTQIRWFVGLGTGTNPEQVAVQEEVVADFNASQDEIELVLEIVPYDSARDTLSTQIASGSAPDIIGPVGWAGSNAFVGQWLDLTPYIEATNYDTTQFDPALVKFYQTEEGQVGLPFAVFPGAVYYNPALFDEAGLNYPPQTYGDPYVMPDGTEVEWSYETVREIALILTVDANGNDATSPDFDKENLVQVGFEPQWQSVTSWGTFFGAGRIYNDNNEAVIPDSFKAGWKYIYDGKWGEQPFIANGPLAASPEWGGGNIFNAGKAAMGVTQTWYTCCLADFAAAGNEFQLGVLPSYNGEVHGRVDADTFRVWKGTKNPEAAFTVLSYLIGDGSIKLLPIYGAMPARAERVQDFFDLKTKDYPFVTQESWDVFVQGLSYPDTPSAEGYMPNWQEGWNRLQTFQDLLNNTPGLDLDAEIATLESDLTVIFQK